MEAEEKLSGYKPSQKKKGKKEQNKEFLDKLDEAMEVEEKHSGYKPSQKKEVNLTNQEIFENNLKKALKQEEKIVDNIHQENKLEKNHILKMVNKIL